MQIFILSSLGTTQIKGDTQTQFFFKLSEVNVGYVWQQDIELQRIRSHSFNSSKQI